MTNSLKGFVIVSDLVLNTPQTVCSVGELSQLSRTFSKEQQEFVDPAYPGYKLNVFSSLTESGSSYVPSPVVTNQTIKMVSVCRNIAVNSWTPLMMRTGLTSSFLPSEVNNVLVGPAVPSTNPNSPGELPAWIAWTCIVSGATTEIRIWLSDNSFQNEYDLFSITVVPLFNDLSVYHQNYADFRTTMNTAVDLTLFNDRVQLTRGIYPETQLRYINIKRVNPLNPSEFVNVIWACLIYGKRGDNTEAMRSAILQHITASSTYTTSQWLTIFPSLSQKNEFLIVPMWHKVAIPNLGVASSVYKSNITMLEIMNFIKSNFFLYTFSPTTLVDTHLHVTTFPFKNITCGVYDGDKNEPAKAFFPGAYPDYISVSTASSDFMRMSQETRDWVELMNLLLIHAESYTSSSSLPIDVRVTIRAGKTFLSKELNGALFLVAVRSNTVYGV